MANLRDIVFPMLLAFCIFLLVAFAAEESSEEEEENTMFKNYHIHITNNLPSTLGLRCQDKNLDLGDKIMSPGEDYTWDTQIDLFRSRLFFCNARWGKTKQMSFDAFRAKRDEDRCEVYHNSCMWSIRSDGIYFSNDNSTWNNEYPW